MPPLTTKVSAEPPSSTRRNAERECGERDRIGAQRREDRRDDVANVAGQQVVDFGAEQQHDEEQAADHRHREQQLQRRFGDELHHDERPVGRGDERAALQGGLQWQVVSHRADFQFTLCGILLPKVSAPETPFVRDRYVSWRRLLVGGVLLALVGRAHRRRRSNGALRQRPSRGGRAGDQEVRRDFDAMTARLARLASAIAPTPPPPRP